MRFERAGHHTINFSDEYAAHSYYSFVPTPMCEIDIKPDEELLELLSKAQRQIGLLEGSCRYISNIENVTSLILKKEASASCNIDDDRKFSALDILISLKHRSDKMQPVQNYVRGLEYGINELKGRPLTNRVIFATHRVLMEHRRDAEIIGDVRRKQNIIGEYMVTSPGVELYNPPNLETVGACMADIQRFIKKVDSADALIKTALLHYQLEVVHPFESGNGKIGRILILMYLFKTKMLNHTLLPVSEFLEVHKVEYFDRIKAVYNHGHYEQWVKFFLTALAVFAETSIRRIEKALQMRDKNLAQIKTYGRDTKYLLDAYLYAEKHIFLDVATLADGIGVSYNTAAKVVRSLTDLGILKLLKEQARNRVYFYADFLEAMETRGKQITP